MKSTCRKLFGRSTFSYQQIYLDQHELLIIDGTYTEELRRLPYRDMTAVIWTGSSAYAIVNAVTGLLVLIAGTAFLSGASTRFAHESLSGGEIFGMLIGLPSLVVLIANLAKGPTCYCAIRTRVQQVKLNNVNRIRGVKKLLKELEPMIEQAQGARSLIVELVRAHFEQAEARKEAERRAAIAAKRGPPAYDPTIPESQQRALRVPPPLPIRTETLPPLPGEGA